MMRRGARTAVLLTLLMGLLMVAAQPASAQDVQVDAPVFEVGDEIVTVSEDGVETSVIVESDATGILLRVHTAKGLIQFHRYDADLNLYDTRLENGNVRKTFEPHIFRYKFPLYVGSRWTGQYVSVFSMKLGETTPTPNKTAISTSCEVLCIERITVRAGSFETFKISCELDEEDESDLTRRTYWYAPAVGATVRSETENVASGSQIEWYELYAFKRANPVEFNVLSDGVDSTCEPTVSMNDTGVLVQD